jgi:3-hexulose-6-phosphate synthase
MGIEKTVKPTIHHSPMLLQLAVDLTDQTVVLDLLDQVADQVDIIEVGTPLLIKSGVRIISTLKAAYPDKRILADLKIMDAGGQESALAFDAGADIVTVLGLAHEATMLDAMAQAHRADGLIMADMIAAPDVTSRARALDAMGVDMICLHTAYDVQAQGVNPVNDIQKVKSVTQQTTLAIAGGIDPVTLTAVIPFAPDIIVVGGFITTHADPCRAVQNIRAVMDTASKPARGNEP